MKTWKKKIYVSETNIEHEFVMDPFDRLVIWVNSNKNDCFGYTFPISDDKIDWECEQSITALIQDDVRVAANKFARECRLIAFS